jgi:hypothetical protein
LHVEDKLIQYGPLALSLRQAFVLILFGCIALDIWKGLLWLQLSETLRYALTALPLILALVVAFARFADRSVENWVLVLLRYWSLPKIYVWQRLPHPSPVAVSPTEHRSPRSQTWLAAMLESEEQEGRERR